MDTGEGKQSEIASRLDEVVAQVDQLRVDLEDRITVQMWKYKGSNVFSPGLGSGEFCVWMGEPTVRQIYLSV